jgi:hypothetical protein
VNWMGCLLVLSRMDFFFAQEKTGLPLGNCLGFLADVPK